MEIVVDEDMMSMEPTLSVCHLMKNALADGIGRGRVATYSPRYTHFQRGIYHDHYIDLGSKSSFDKDSTLNSYQRSRTASCYPSTEVLAYARMNNGIDLSSMLFTGEQIGSEEGLVGQTGAIKLWPQQGCQLVADGGMSGEEAFTGIVTKVNRNTQ